MLRHAAQVIKTGNQRINSVVNFIILQFPLLNQTVLLFSIDGLNYRYSVVFWGK